MGELTDDRLPIIAGRRTKLAEEIQKTYGTSKEEAEKQVRDFEKAARH